MFAIRMASNFLSITIVTLVIVPQAYNSLVVVMEQNRDHKGTSNLNLLFSDLQYDLIAVDGNECNEFTTGGSVLVSGIQKLLPTLIVPSELNVTMNVVMIVDKCITELRTLKHILEKMKYSVVF